MDLQPDAVAEPVEVALVELLARRLGELGRLAGRDVTARTSARRSRARGRPRAPRDRRARATRGSAASTRPARRTARRRPPRTCASCRPSSATRGRAARCRRSPARRPAISPWPDSWPARALRAGATITSSGSSQPCSSATACIAARTSSAVSPAPQLADQVGAGAHAGVRGLLRAADAVELVRRLGPPAQHEQVLVDASARGRPSRRWSATKSGNSGGTAARVDAQLAARARRAISASICDAREPASSSSSRPSAYEVEHLDAVRRDLVAVEHRHRRRAAPVGLHVQERVDDPGRDRVEEVRRRVGGSVDQQVRQTGSPPGAPAPPARGACSGCSRRRRRGPARRRARARAACAAACRVSQACWAEALDDPVGVVALRPACDEREQDALGEQRAATSARGSRACGRRARSCRARPAARGASIWSSRIVASGRTMRSAQECEMSRSCHSATFSRPTWA